MIKVVEERRVGLSAPQVHITDFEVVKDCFRHAMISSQSVSPSSVEDWEGKGRTQAVVVVGTAVIGQEFHRIVRRDEMGVLGYEFCSVRGT